jgi:hypothetical protein
MVQARLALLEARSELAQSAAVVSVVSTPNKRPQNVLMKKCYHARASRASFEPRACALVSRKLEAINVRKGVY